MLLRPLAAPDSVGAGALGCLGFGLEAREERFGRTDAADRRSAAPRQEVADRWAAVAVGGVRILVPELRQEARRRRGQEGRARQPEEPARLEEVAQHATQALLGRTVAGLDELGQLPRSFRVHQTVR